MNEYENIDERTRVYYVSASEYAAESVNTMLNEWDYDDFLPLETYVLFSDDRKAMAMEQQEIDSKPKKPM